MRALFNCSIVKGFTRQLKDPPQATGASDRIFGFKLLTKRSFPEERRQMKNRYPGLGNVDGAASDQESPRSVEKLSQSTPATVRRSI